MCKINGHFAKKLSTTSQIIGGGSANPFFYIVFTAGSYMISTICTSDAPATKDAATMKVENKIRIFIATPTLVVATTVFLKDNSY